MLPGCSGCAAYSRGELSISARSQLDLSSISARSAPQLALSPQLALWSLLAAVQLLVTRRRGADAAHTRMGGPTDEAPHTYTPTQTHTHTHPHTHTAQPDKVLLRCHQSAACQSLSLSFALSLLCSFLTSPAFCTQVLMNENFGAGYGSDCSCKSSSSVNQE